MNTAMIASLVAAATVAGAPPPSLPTTQAETASGRSIVLPAAVAGRVGVLVVGFSKRSSDVTERWEARMARDYGSSTRVSMLRVAVLESVPRLLRGFVRGRIERTVPAAKRDQFVFLFHQEDEWKSLVHFEAPDDAYLVVLDADGKVAWRGHGAADLAGYEAMKGQIDGLLRGR